MSFPEISEPVRKFVEPIKKRWVYHFIVSPKTSAVDKPEWYLNQTIKWIYQHIDRVENELGKHARYEFIISMLQCVLKRLKKDMKEITDGIKNPETKIHYETILIHTYNEVITFVKFLRQLLTEARYFSLDESYDLMSAFYDQDLFEKIIDVEWEHSRRILEEEIFKLEDGWQPVLTDEYTDPYKIPRYVDKFLMLLGSITERVECFNQEDCQFKLIELQCHLLESFLKFLRKSARSTPSTSFGTILSLRNAILAGGLQNSDSRRTNAIVNGANFLRLVLKTDNIILESLRTKLDTHLKERLTRLAREYTDFYDTLCTKQDSLKSPSAALDKLKSM